MPAPAPNLQAIPGENYAQYQARLGAQSGAAGSGAGFGTPKTFDAQSYLQGKDPTSLQNFQNANPGKTFTSEDLGQYMNAKPAPIQNPVQAPNPSTTGTPTPQLPTPQAPQTNQSYMTSATADAEAAKKALQDSYQKQIDDLTTQGKTAQDKIDQLNLLEQNGMANIGTLSQPFRQQFEDNQRQILHVNENFEANQKLTNELDSLLQQGNDLIAQQKGQPIATEILTKYVNKTITDVSARAGVIQAVMAARNNQISVANNLIDRSVTAMNADRQDQLNYYKELNNFYQNQKDEEGKKLITLDANKQKYIDAQIGQLENDLKSAQANADRMKQAMQDPATAQAYGQAGVTLNDSPEVVNQKLTAYAYTKELSDESTKMAQQGISALLPGQKAPANTQIFTTTDSQGKTHQWYQPMKAGAGGVGDISNLSPAGQSWVTNILNGNATMANVPAALKNEVSLGLTNQPADAYSPLAASRFSTAANKIEANYLDLPQYKLTSGGLPYLQRIQAAMTTPGSISDQDLLDSLTKLNTSGNAITDAQVRLITSGQSFSDMISTFGNKFKNGGVLSDNQRQQIQTIAQKIYDSYAKGFQPVYDQVTKQLQAAGIPKAFWTIPDLNNLSGQQGGSGSADTSTIGADISQAIHDTANFKTREDLIDALVTHYGISQDEASKKVYATWTDNTKR